MRQKDKNDIYGIIALCKESELHDKRSMGDMIIDFIKNHDRGR